MTGMIILGCTCIAMIFIFVHYEESRDNSFEKEREQWRVERKELLDRVQAPSYDHLKHHEAKIIKAGKDPVKEPNTLEVV